MSDSKSQEDVIGVAICPLHKNKNPEHLARGVFRLLNGVGIRPSEISRLYVNPRSGYARILLRDSETENYLMRILPDIPNLMHVHNLSAIIRNPLALKVTRLSHFCPNEELEDPKSDPVMQFGSKKSRRSNNEEDEPSTSDVSTQSEPTPEFSFIERSTNTVTGKGSIKQRAKGKRPAASGTVSREASISSRGSSKTSAGSRVKSSNSKNKTVDNMTSYTTKALEGTPIDLVDVAPNSTTKKSYDIASKNTRIPKDSLETTAARLVAHAIGEADRSMTMDKKRPADSSRPPDIAVFSDTSCSVESLNETDCVDLDEEIQSPFRADVATSTADIPPKPEEEQAKLRQVEAKTSTPFTPPCSCPGTIFYNHLQYIGTETRYAEFKCCGMSPREHIYNKPDSKSNFEDLIGKYVCGFLNSEGGTLYLGVRDDGMVLGIRMKESFKEKVRGDIEYTIGIIRPTVENSEYTINFPEVKKANADVKLYSDLRVVEVCVKPRNPPKSYYSFLKVIYLRRDGSLQTVGVLDP